MMFLYLLHLVFFFDKRVLIDFNILFERLKLALFAYDLLLSDVGGSLQLSVLLIELIELTLKLLEISTGILE